MSSMNTPAEEFVVLVDTEDNVHGLAEKMAAHHSGQLHRAISVLIFNEAGEWLLHRRALSKYHSAGLWTNACCSHPRMDESALDAANRRLMEEMGMTVKLDYAFQFIYRAELGNGLIEHELDHVFIGQTNQLPMLNPYEVDAFRYVSTQDLVEEISQSPEAFTAWFLLLVDHMRSHNLIPIANLATVS
jgi:isopentenyl-diphosphate Delta-isomerase